MTSDTNVSGYFLYYSACRVLLLFVLIFICWCVVQIGLTDSKLITRFLLLIDFYDLFLFFSFFCVSIALNTDINLCRVDDSEPCRLPHSRRGSWISGEIALDHVIRERGRSSVLLQLFSGFFQMCHTSLRCLRVAD